MAGKIRCWNWLADPRARPGRGGYRQPLQCHAEHHDDHDPGHEFGQAGRESPVTEMTRSTPRPSYSAAITPPMMPSGTTITNASKASLIELIRAARMKGSTADR